MTFNRCSIVACVPDKQRWKSEVKSCVPCALLIHVVRDEDRYHQRDAALEERSVIRERPQEIEILLACSLHASSPSGPKTARSSAATIASGATGATCSSIARPRSFRAATFPSRPPTPSHCLTIRHRFLAGVEVAESPREGLQQAVLTAR